MSSKAGALVILKGLLGRPIDMELLEQEPEQSQQVHDTVIEETSVQIAEGVEVEFA